MAIAFSPGQELSRGDLDIFLTNPSGAVSNASQISYALYYFDEEEDEEVLIGNPNREPVNPAVGEYYAALLIPPSAEPAALTLKTNQTVKCTSIPPPVMTTPVVVVVGN